jgi:circadian clock protein KaiB
MKDGSKQDEPQQERWQLRLYVAGMTPEAQRALANLESLCEEHVGDRYSIEVVDLLERPQLAADEQIFALPTVVRKLPLPVRKIIGDLSDTTKVVVGLDLRPS